VDKKSICYGGTMSNDMNNICLRENQEMRTVIHFGRTYDVAKSTRSVECKIIYIHIGEQVEKK